MFISRVLELNLTLNLSSWFIIGTLSRLVSIRHEATHARMPFLGILRPGAKLAMEWLEVSALHILSSNHLAAEIFQHLIQLNIDLDRKTIGARKKETVSMQSGLLLLLKRVASLLLSTIIH